MGNRAVITTAERKIGVYLHWNGGRDTVEPLLQRCELKGYRAPSSDDYGWARLCQVVGNFFGGTLSVGVMLYSDEGRMDPGDNGIYAIEGWRSVDRILPYESLVEQKQYDFDEMLRAFDESMLIPSMHFSPIAQTDLRRFLLASRRPSSSAAGPSACTTCP